ncbi:hypothetical protein [Noviherbaspirillum galbum]|uniref:Uncharacterized protein n=1 Tax=Noviherbaspirillum galbum TaxID=2709383 RepID=A0A6B3SHG4_9BURK|nr:hypothetical protein [Noviherbaspirillum galbum]NEX60100.1 hypothetical protein [Noviherbaspirillum galbum]
MTQDARSRLIANASAGDTRDPRITPSRLDKLMASAGGNAAQYRIVHVVEDDIVTYIKTSRPASDEGVTRQCTLASWRNWAAKAVVVHQASLSFYIPDAGWMLHWEVIAALDELDDVPSPS